MGSNWASNGLNAANKVASGGTLSGPPVAAPTAFGGGWAGAAFRVAARGGIASMPPTVAPLPAGTGGTFAGSALNRALGAVAGGPPPPPPPPPSYTPPTAANHWGGH